MKIKTVLLATTIGIGFVASIGFVSYKLWMDSTERERLQEAFGKDSGYTETILKVEADTKTMTYQELFLLCDRSIQERTDLIIALRGGFLRTEAGVKTALIELLNAEQEVGRSKKAFYGSDLDLTNQLGEYIELDRRLELERGLHRNPRTREQLESALSSAYARQGILKVQMQMPSKIRRAAEQVEFHGKSFRESYVKAADLEARLIASKTFLMKPVFRDHRAKVVEDADKALKFAAETRKRFS